MTEPNSPATVTHRLVSQVNQLVSGSLPADVVEVAKHSILDWFAGAVSGSGEPLVVALAAEVAEQGGAPTSTVLATGGRTGPALAAWVNGAAADAHDYADSNNSMRGHTTPGVVAAALAMSEAGQVRGADFIRAVVAGIEMETRVGRLVNLGPTGFHPTGNLAPFGTASAAAELLGLDDGQRAYALGLAATQAAGLRASGGTMAKPLHSGFAAMNGVLAAKLAGRGFLSRPDAIEAPWGFLTTRGAPAGAGGPLDELDGRYLIKDTVYKTYAACMLTHATITNMLRARQESGVSAERTVSIDLRVPTLQMSVCNIQEPGTALESKFSLRGTAAMALLGDDMGSLDSYTGGKATRPAVLELLHRVTVTEVPEAADGYSVAIIVTSDGETVEFATGAAKPESDLVGQRETLRRKLITLTAPVIGTERAARLYAQIIALDELKSVTPLLQAAVGSLD